MYWNPTGAPQSKMQWGTRAELHDCFILFFLCMCLNITTTAFKGDSGWNMKPQRQRVGEVCPFPSMSPFSPGNLVSLWRQEFRVQAWRAKRGEAARRILQMPIRQILTFSAINLSIPQNKSFSFIWEFGFCSCRFMQCAETRPRDVSINDVTDSVRMLFSFSPSTAHWGTLQMSCVTPLTN